MSFVVSGGQFSTPELRNSSMWLGATPVKLAVRSRNSAMILASCRPTSP